MTGFGFDFVNGILMLSISIIPVFLVLKTTGNIKKLLIILSLFTVIHGVYHFSDVMGFELLADSVFRPVSVGVLIVFGIFAYFVTRKNTVKRGVIKQ